MTVQEPTAQQIDSEILENEYINNAQYMESVLNGEMVYESKIACPLAGEKLEKRLVKLIKKAHCLDRIVLGLKECRRQLLKGNKGFVILSGDVTPEDTITGIPYLCREKKVPYCFVRFQHLISAATGYNIPIPLAMIFEDKITASNEQEQEDPQQADPSKENEFKEAYRKCVEGVTKLHKD